jgi:hypothetical protein
LSLKMRFPHFSFWWERRSEFRTKHALLFQNLDGMERSGKHWQPTVKPWHVGRRVYNIEPEREGHADEILRHGRVRRFREAQRSDFAVKNAAPLRKDWTCGRSRFWVFRGLVAFASYWGEVGPWLAGCCVSLNRDIKFGSLAKGLCDRRRFACEVIHTDCDGDRHSISHVTSHLHQLV